MAAVVFGPVHRVLTVVGTVAPNGHVAIAVGVRADRNSTPPSAVMHCAMRMMI